MPGPLTYLACPYSHPERAVRVARFEAANAAAARLMQQGHKVFSPISHTHPIAEAGALPLGWDFWQAFDRAYLSHSGRVIVLRVDGWEQSRGVQAEIAIAAEYGISVEYIAEQPAAGPSEEMSALARVKRERDEARAEVARLRNVPAMDSFRLIALDAATYAEGAGEPEFSQFLALEARLLAIGRARATLGRAGPLSESVVTQALDLQEQPK